MKTDTYWYKHCKNLEKEIAKLKEELKKYRPITEDRK